MRNRPLLILLFFVCVAVAFFEGVLVGFAVDTLTDDDSDSTARVADSTPTPTPFPTPTATSEPRPESSVRAIVAGEDACPQGENLVGVYWDYYANGSFTAKAGVCVERDDPCATAATAAPAPEACWRAFEATLE